MKKLTKAQIVEQAQEMGMFVTCNAISDHVTKNLLEANERLVKLEFMVKSLLPLAQQVTCSVLSQSGKELIKMEKQFSEYKTQYWSK